MTPQQKYRLSVFGIICGLLVQLFIGMVVNLYVTLPKEHPGSHASNYFDGVGQAITWAIAQGPWSLLLHVTLGMLLIIGSIGLAIKAWMRPSVMRRVLTSIAALALIFASFNGASFLNYGQEVSSLLMTSGLMVAIFCYCLVLLKDETTPTPQNLI